MHASNLDDDRRWVWVDFVGRSEVGERFVAVGETNRYGAGDVGPVEYGDGHGVAERDEVADVH
jgi:hypothetical protein